MNSKSRNTSLYVKLPIFLSLALVCGIFIGAVLSNNHTKNNITGNYLKYMEILNLVDKDYVDTVDIESLVEFSIDKMLEKLDPHTYYIPKREIDMVHSQLESGFEGIGVEFNIIKDTINVVSPINGGPSEAVGIQAGDKIIKVDGENFAGVGLTNADVFKKLRGKKGTKVILSIQRKRKEKLIEYTVVRDKIPTYSIDVSYMVDKEVGYIKVNRFADATYVEFREHLDALIAKGMKTLILDLKDNPGGYLDRATDMVDEMLSDGKLIVYTDGKGSKFDQKIFANASGVFEKGAVIVLINEGSASASEIVSGAIQDNDRGVIVGRRSFGKGLVQRQIPLSDQSELRLTISRYYTPSGRCIQKPYDTDDMESYGQDLLNRYKHGEFFSADSVYFADSLKYKTTKGRIVYGGGGVMPDVFVPRDTSDITNYLLSLFNKNLIREFTLDYYTNNKEKIAKYTLEDFKNNFQVTDDMLGTINEMAQNEGVKFNKAEFEKSKNFLKLNVKAYIARSQFGNDGFYPIINQTDEIYMAALQQVKFAKELEKGKIK